MSEEPGASTDTVYGPLFDRKQVEWINSFAGTFREQFKNQSAEFLERFDRTFLDTVLNANPLANEITILRLLLVEESNRPESPKVRKRRGEDQKRCQEGARTLVQGLQEQGVLEAGDEGATDELIEAVAAWARNLVQHVREETKKELQDAKAYCRNPDLLARIVNAISTCENVRARLQSQLAQDRAVFNFAIEYTWLAQILSDVLKDHLTLYWKVVKQINARYGRRQILGLKEAIEAEMRKRGELGPDELLEE